MFYASLLSRGHLPWTPNVNLTAWQVHEFFKADVDTHLIWPLWKISMSSHIHGGCINEIKNSACLHSMKNKCVYQHYICIHNTIYIRFALCCCLLWLCNDLVYPQDHRQLILRSTVHGSNKEIMDTPYYWHSSGNSPVTSRPITKVIQDAFLCIDVFRSFCEAPNNGPNVEYNISKNTYPFDYHITHIKYA